MVRGVFRAYGVKTILALSAIGQGFFLGQDVLKGQEKMRLAVARRFQCRACGELLVPYSCSPRLVSVTDVGPGMTRRRL